MARVVFFLVKQESLTASTFLREKTTAQQVIASFEEDGSILL